MSVMAALELKRSVRVVLSRKQMFTFGHRPPTLQTMRFGADASGRLTALGHAALGETSQFEDYIENVVNWGGMLYPAENTKLEYQIIPMDVFSPLDMRAPGGSTGMHAIESTLDELAYALHMDPVQLRLANYTTTDPSKKKPYTSKELKACYEQGAERFGWYNRNPEPRSMRRGSKLVGYGMATGIWEANQLVARVAATVRSDGKLHISSAVTDIGTGTKTVMAQIAADELGLPIENVIVGYGDSDMPFAPIQGGSFTLATLGSAIQASCMALRKKLLKIAAKAPDSPFSGLKTDDVVFRDGMFFLKDNPAQIMSLQTVIELNKGKEVRTVNTGLPRVFKTKNYARAAHSAAFVEVEVDEELGIIQVKRALTTVAAGRIINPKTARSQILGGMVWGISKALMEETSQDHRLGKYMNPNLAEYHIPVHADVHDLDVVFVEEKDELINGLGIKGVGEIGLVAMVPAITNAIFHATGKRIHKLPVRLDALL
ncbi:xanthine dehydrogenase family protein molybdopterin-binding subunit [Dyadobacter sandarakinus]|uniref:xanthine dehydrogenase family protein molybdopterin-binding subunit n=1 Tax=Dyadobacter sandarakinus TaxID=2747268 RepID=UPI00286E72BE|nr:xanthine dehydrogenase family protein molybdopterin-binding subunit [Dyadobacter sandarakinus]